MPLPEDPKGPNIRSSFERLSKTANSLNSATDQLNEAVEQLNVALKKLNLGIASWLVFSSWDDGPFCGTEEIGYAKVQDKWGIALRTTDYDPSKPRGEENDVTYWHFADAPRDMRINSIACLQKLIDKLNEDAEKATKAITEKTSEAKAFAEAITNITSASPVARATNRGIPVQPITGGTK